MKGFVEETLWLFNGTPGQPDSFDRLDALLSAQAYRVAYWGVAGDEINYRRFFDVNDLAAIRMEEPAVFEAAHGLLLGPGRARAASPGSGSTTPTASTPPRSYLGRAPGAVRARAGRWAPGHGARAALLRGGREGAAAGRVAPRPLAGARHHRLRVPQRAERALRGPEGRARPRADLPALHGADRRLRRRRPRDEAARHGHDDGQRAERPRPAPRAPRRAAARVPRLHGAEPDRGSARGRRLLSGLPVLRRRRRPGGRRAGLRARGAGGVGSQAPEPDHEPVRLRLHRGPPLSGRASWTSCGASSSSPVRSPPRASRTPPSTGTAASSR